MPINILVPAVAPGHATGNITELQAALDAKLDAADLVAHATASDPHSVYQKESEKGIANGYASLDGDGLVSSEQLPAYGGGGAAAISEVEIDVGATPVAEATVQVTDAAVTTASRIIGGIAYKAPTGKDIDELSMDALEVKFEPGVGVFNVFIKGLEGYIADKFKIWYLASA